MSSSEESTEDIVQNLSDTVLDDTISLAMQNAVSIQQGMQVITNTSVSSSCALILKQGI